MSKKIEFSLTPSPKEEDAENWVKHRSNDFEGKEAVKHATLKIPVDLYKKIKLKAAQDDITVKDLILKIFYRGFSDFF